MKMKTRHLIFPILLLFASLTASAQNLYLAPAEDNTFSTDTTANADSLALGIPPALDSALIGYDIYRYAAENNVRVNRTPAEHFPTIPVYRSYMNPYFKVVAGDYRTKSDAMRELGAIKEIFPNAFIIKEYINFPQL